MGGYLGKKIHLVSWLDVSKDKKHQGLGIRRLEVLN